MFEVLPLCVMWTFPGLLFLFFISAFPSAWIVRAISPWFWNLSTPPLHILIKVTTIPEIENAVYITYIVVFVLLFGIMMGVTRWLLRRFDWVSKGIMAVNYTCTLYLLIVPYKSFFVLDQINPWIFLISAAVGFVLGFWYSLPSSVLSSLVGIVAIRYSLKPLAKYDVGAKQFPTVMEYIYFGLSRGIIFLAFMVLYVVIRTFTYVRNFVSRFSKKRLMVIIFFSISVTLLYLMTKSHDPIDIYFTFLPAYQIIKGGTLLVNVMSQYGLLYLAPWVLWLLVFPHAPVSFPVGTVIVAVLLMVYFLFLLLVVYKLIRHTLIFALTACASFYFPVLIRYYGFPDPVSLVSTPAFTPLRFGIFIVPFWFLLSHCQSGRSRDFMIFLITSIVCFFYSFEVGIGIAAAGMAVALVNALISGENAVKQCIVYAKIVVGTGIGCLVVISAGIYLHSGQLPDWGLYSYFSKMFGLGLLMLPMEGQTGVFLPIGVALFGGIFGLWRLVAQKHRDGLVFLYLALLNIVELPYYMGRSVFPTLYNISIPFIFLCGVLVEYGVSVLRKNTFHLCALAMTGICSYILVIGGMRAIIITGHNVLHGAEVIESSGRYMHKAFSHWSIKETPQYAFLKKNLPAGCPLMLFDEDEFELLTAMDVPPAFTYSFVRGFLISKEEVDGLRPFTGATRICLFTNIHYINFHDVLSDGTITYFFSRYGSRLRVIQKDERQGFTLYELPRT